MENPRKDPWTSHEKCVDQWIFRGMPLELSVDFPWNCHVTIISWKINWYSPWVVMSWVFHGNSMAISYGQKLMENSWVFLLRLSRDISAMDRTKPCRRTWRRAGGCRMRWSSLSWDGFWWRRSRFDQRCDLAAVDCPVSCVTGRRRRTSQAADSSRMSDPEVRSACREFYNVHDAQKTNYNNN